MRRDRVAATVLGVTVSTISIACSAQSIGSSHMKPGEILPAAEERYQLTADNRPRISLNASKVPSDLADLVPLAEKWGINDDVIRNDFQSKSSDADKQALVKALTGRNDRITKWLDSQPKDGAMSDEAAAFMYMQLGLDEMGLWVD